MNSWRVRIQAIWNRLFFWHTSSASHEIKPSVHADHELVLQVTKRDKVPHWHQWRLFRRLLSAREQQIFFASAAIAVIALTVGAGDLLAPHVTHVPASGGTLTEGLVGAPQLINPLFANSNDVDLDLSALVYSGLFRMDAQLQPQPDLAQSYQWLNDGKTLQVTLRSDARFQDNQPVTADDVVFTYQSAQDPHWHSPLASLFQNIHVLEVDPQTVQFQLDKPQPALPSDLTLGILPAHIWSDVQPNNAQLAEANLKPIGSGPYQFESFTRDPRGSILSYRLQRFDGYYGIKPWIQTWQFQFFPDHAAAQSALTSHQIDALAFVPWGEAQTLQQSSLHNVSLNMPQETIAFFNVQNPLLHDQRVRHALSLVIDRTALQALLGAHTNPVYEPFPFLNSTSSVPNVDEARNELTDAGWVLSDGDGLRHFTPPAPVTTHRGRHTTAQPPAAVASTSTPALTLTIEVPEQPDLLRVADYLKQRWLLLGAQVNIESQNPEPLLRQATETRTYQVLIWNILLSPDQDLTPFWSSKNATRYGFNLSNIQDSTIDQDLQNVANASTTQALQQARTILSRQIVSLTPALFLLRPAYTYVISNRVQGTTDQLISRPSDRLLQTMGWYLSTGIRWK